MIWAIHYERLRRVHAAFRAVLEERGRLAREMHDTLIQGCAGVSLLLEACASAEGDDPEVRLELVDYARTQLAALESPAKPRRRFHDRAARPHPAGRRPPIVRVGLAALIATRPDMIAVAQAGSGAEAIELHREHQPDITLMDLRLPDISGVETIRAIRAETPEALFIVLTTYEGDEDIHQALQAGARGYIIKGLPHDLLADAIQRVHAGGTYLPPAVKRTLARRTPSSDLSARERDILVRIAQGKSNREIAAELNIAEITVK